MWCNVLKIIVFVILLLFIGISFVSVDAVSIFLNESISITDNVNVTSIQIDNSTFTELESPGPINPLAQCQIAVNLSEVDLGEVKRGDTSIVKTIQLSLTGASRGSLSVDGERWNDINGNKIISTSNTQFWIVYEEGGLSHTSLTTLTNAPIDVGDIQRHFPLLFSYNVTANLMPNVSEFVGIVTQNISFDVSGC